MSLQLMPFTMLHLSFHQVPITVGWIEAAWTESMEALKRLPNTSTHGGGMTRAPVTHNSNQARSCLSSVL